MVFPPLSLFFLSLSLLTFLPRPGNGLTNLAAARKSGMYQNANMMKEQLGPFMDILGDTATFDFLEGESPDWLGERKETILGMFGPGPHYEWWHMQGNKDLDQGLDVFASEV
jgi:hypothetical protein